MSKTREERLVQMDQKGIIPGPMESWQEWADRTALYENHSVNIKHSVVLETLEWHWGISPDWIDVEEKDSGFWPWHGASCEIFEDGRIVVTVNSGATFFCSLDELIIHELSHAARASFEEGCFDEYLAYALSPSFIRKSWGSFFSQRAWVPILWVLSWVCPSMFFFYGSLSSIKVAYYLVSSGWTFAFVRHYFMQKKYDLAWKKLREEFPEEVARWMIFRLSEEEALGLADGQFSIQKDLVGKDLPRSKLFEIKIRNVERV
ncbi:hypothetical protein [Candidatus Similichlamydia epinepheli]|uniref:hypothetical protein n=1 Tax=Candidatus Similichlamydia epinepheli TaxID=1903953 RepID=UPI0013002305|nr:hypothetical protein [Candidatus Similichlamydia epinepheli]